jgi:hypothetical protein
VVAVPAGEATSALGRALAKVGRMAKTTFLLAYLGRSLPPAHPHPDQGEVRHALARKAFHGYSGGLRLPYREGQEDPSLAPSGSSSTPSLSGTLATWPPPSTTPVPTRPTSGRRMSNASHPYATATSIPTVGTSSPSGALARGNLRSLRSVDS